MSATTAPARSVAAIRRDVDTYFRETFPARTDILRAGSGYRLLQGGASSAKLRKNERRTYGLAMPPYRVWWNPAELGAMSYSARPGYRTLGNVCPWEDHCAAGCIAETGHYGMGQSAVRLWVRVLWHHHRTLFLELLNAELGAVNARARAESRRARRRRSVAVRLNVTSDVQWHKYVDVAQYSHVDFYGYTKSLRDASGELPANYDLTFSVSARVAPEDLPAVMVSVRRVAVVVPDELAASAPTWAGFPAVNGDDTDERDRDPRGVAALLRIKLPTSARSTLATIYRSGMVRGADGSILWAPAQ